MTSEAKTLETLLDGIEQFPELDNLYTRCFNRIVAQKNVSARNARKQMIRLDKRFVGYLREARKSTTATNQREGGK